MCLQFMEKFCQGEKNTLKCKPFRTEYRLYTLRCAGWEEPGERRESSERKAEKSHLADVSATSSVPDGVILEGGTLLEIRGCVLRGT